VQSPVDAGLTRRVAVTALRNYEANGFFYIYKNNLSPHKPTGYAASAATG